MPQSRNWVHTEHPRSTTSPTDDHLPSAPAAAALATLVEEHGVDLILFGMNNTDRDVGGRLSARLGRPVLGQRR